jgi:hypothetical protein
MPSRMQAAPPPAPRHPTACARTPERAGSPVLRRKASATTRRGPARRVLPAEFLVNSTTLREPGPHRGIRAGVPRTMVAASRSLNPPGSLGAGYTSPLVPKVSAALWAHADVFRNSVSPTRCQGRKGASCGQPARSRNGETESCRTPAIPKALRDFWEQGKFELSFRCDWRHSFVHNV